MISICRYRSPLGNILLAADDQAVTGLWFEGQKHYAYGLPQDAVQQTTPLLQEAVRWLDGYFSGSDLPFCLPLRPAGTPFQESVWTLLLTIPRGQTMTYGEIAAKLHCLSAQAVGNAVGRNPISILIPCHRVIGARGSLTGYAGGLDRKRALLELENA